MTFLWGFMTVYGQYGDYLRCLLICKFQLSNPTCTKNSGWIWW